MSFSKKAIDRLETRVAELRYQNRKMREALEFYANRQNWERDEWGLPNCIDEAPDMNNGGATARAALQEIGDE